MDIQTENTTINNKICQQKTNSPIINSECGLNDIENKIETVLENITNVINLRNGNENYYTITKKIGE